MFINSSKNILKMLPCLENANTIEPQLIVSLGIRVLIDNRKGSIIMTN